MSVNGGKRKRSDGGTFTLCSSVIAKCGNVTKQLCQNRLYEFNEDDTWNEVLYDVLDGGEFDFHKTDTFVACVSSKLSGTVTFTPDMNEPIRIVKEFDNSLKYVMFTIHRDEEVGFAKPDSECRKSTEMSAFTIMMNASTTKKNPKLKDKTVANFTAKDQLFNDLVQEFKETGDGFPSSMPDKSVAEQMQLIVNAVWYISGNMPSIMERSSHIPADIKPVPQRFLKYDGVNDFKKKKHKRPVLLSKELKLHSQCLYGLSGRPFAQHWIFKDDVEKLAICLDQYARYLDTANEKQKLRQSFMSPVRVVDETISVGHHKKVEKIAPVYIQLSNALNELDNFQPLYFDDQIHVGKQFQNPDQRYKYFRDIQLTTDFHLLKYDPGGGLGIIFYFWKVPEGLTSEDMFIQDNKILSALRSKLPEFHTRQMRREFNTMFENVAGVKIPPYILRSIYASFTNDATTDQNPDIDERVRMSILGSDPELVVDLRHLNKGDPGDTFNVFFEQLEKEVQEITAADERRHNVEHISQYLSIRDMIETVKSKVPDNTPIPTESTVLLAFVPKNAHTKVAKLYKGRIPLRLKVQTRQLRSSHQDDHYCAAIFKNAREYAVKFKGQCNFVCMDDKAKVDFGEPGLYASSGVRGKKSIVPMNSILSCLDHDVQNKGSLTPSVVLDVDVPENEAGSFYRGQVTLSIKDSIFEPSTPFRHIVELQHILEAKGENKPCLFIYTDGGPDHRTTYHAVKLSLIVLFKRLGLEFLVACRTAPGNSWANPAERIMSLLNIAFQNTALARDEGNAEFEQNIRGCSSMSDIRKKAEKVDGLRESWLKSVEGVKSLLASRAERVKLKGKPFNCRSPANSDEVEMAEAEVTLIDPTITIGKYQQQNLAHATEYKQFLAAHCLERHYSFQIRRCDNDKCCPPGIKWSWLPDPVIDHTGNHYKPFETTYGTDTSEKDRPSGQNQTLAAVAQELQGCKNSMMTAQNVRLTVTCKECEKPRCVYSKLKLSPRDTRSLKYTIEKHDYTCGSVITPDGDAMQGKVFVRLQMSCSTHIEFPYYSSNVGRPDICCHCVAPARKDENTLRTHRVVLPVCENCLRKGIPKRMPKK